MPVRLRITLLFTLVVFIILALVASSTYYFTYRSRLNTMKTRLVNRAVTTARLLSQSEIFERRMVEWIDSLTTISLKQKAVEVFDDHNQKIYDYSDSPRDSIVIGTSILNAARLRRNGYYFTIGNREAMAFHFTERGARLVVICAALDEDGNEHLGQLKTILLLHFVFGILIAVAGGYFFSGRLLRPIKKITNEVAEISAQNLARRIQTGDVRDEWFMMSATLNDLLNRLQESFDLQRRFISNASHELSTPLTAVSSQLEVALQRPRSPEEYRKTISRVLEDVQHLNKLTQTLLEFAKAAGNQGGLTINLVRIDEILMDLPAILQRQNNQYEVYLDFGALPDDEEDLLVFGNGDLLAIALTNIVSNACKYSADHRARVGFRLLERSFIITVSDTGDGIPSEEIARIFQPFYRVDNSRSTPGFGLGLSLAYRIVKLHKGDVSVESEMGKGTCFTVRIPSARKGSL